MAFVQNAAHDEMQINTIHIRLIIGINKVICRNRYEGGKNALRIFLHIRFLVQLKTYEYTQI